jgi:hypothetical protein
MIKCLAATAGAAGDAVAYAAYPSSAGFGPKEATDKASSFQLQNKLTWKVTLYQKPVLKKL